MYNWTVEFDNGFFLCGEETTEKEAKEAALNSADVGCCIYIEDPNGKRVYYLRL